MSDGDGSSQITFLVASERTSGGNRRGLLGTDYDRPQYI